MKELRYVNFEMHVSPTRTHFNTPKYSLRHEHPNLGGKLWRQ